jgi:hypothetical protein
VKRGNEEYCDKCHLIIAPKDPSRLDYGKVQYHASCYIAHRRQKEKAAQAA